MARPVPYWLDDGGEICSVCLQQYAYETERRCEDCDIALCPACADAIFGETVVCVECKPGGCED